MVIITGIAGIKFSSLNSTKVRLEQERCSFMIDGHANGVVDSEYFCLRDPNWVTSQLTGV